MASGGSKHKTILNTWSYSYLTTRLCSAHSPDVTRLPAHIDIPWVLAFGGAMYHK